MLTFQPRTEEELISIKAEAEKARLLEKGVYPFKVTSAAFHTSQAGNKSIKLILEVYGKDGKVHIVWDYLSSLDSFLFKTRHFCRSVGIIKKYEEGTLSELDCNNKCGNVLIGIEKNKTGQYKDKNVVLDYIRGDSFYG